MYIPLTSGLFLQCLLGASKCNVCFTVSNPVASLEAMSNYYPVECSTESLSWKNYLRGRNKMWHNLEVVETKRRGSVGGWRPLGACPSGVCLVCGSLLSLHILAALRFSALLGHPLSLMSASPPTQKRRAKCL